MNVLKVLQNAGVVVVEHHPSVSKSCYGLDCPFCNDNNKHLGVFKETGNYSCFKCSAKGTLYNLLKTLKGISFSDYKKLVSEYRTFSDNSKDELDKIFNKATITEKENKLDLKGTISIDKNTPESIYNMIKSYMNRRGFPYSIAQAYNCLYGVSGYFNNRLVIPILDYQYKLNNTYNIIGLVGRSISDAKNRYLFNDSFNKSKHIYLCKKPIINNKLVLVEGIFDAWKVYYETGINASAMFGNVISLQQILIVLSFTNNIYYMPDNDVAESKIIKTMQRLNDFFNVKLIRCTAKDPADMKGADLRRIFNRN